MGFEQRLERDGAEAEFTSDPGLLKRVAGEFVRVNAESVLGVEQGQFQTLDFLVEFGSIREAALLAAMLERKVDHAAFSGYAISAC